MISLFTMATFSWSLAGIALSFSLSAQTPFHYRDSGRSLFQMAR